MQDIVNLRKGHIPWNKGKKGVYSQETLWKLAEAARRRVPVKGVSGHPISDWQKQRIRDSILDEKNPAKRPESRKRISEALRGRIITPEWKKKMSDAAKRVWSDPDYRKRATAERRGRWVNQEYREWLLNKLISSWHVRPNRKEQQLGSILNSLVPFKFRYVGNGEVILGGKCPDFIDCDGTKLIIEFFGAYWHSEERKRRSREEEEQQRIDYFTRYGYRTLIVWESELKQPDLLKQKIISFVERGDTH